MSKVNVCESVADDIKRHASAFPTIEIYGWLLGYDHNDQLFVVSSVPCKQYKMQNQIIAEPSQEEVMEISKAIPMGIGIVGIYHSHVGKVFHSSTDDYTVKQFASVYPYFLSIVTNVEETKYYQLKDESVEEIKVKVSSIKVPQTIRFLTKAKLDHAKLSELNVQTISSKMREILESFEVKQIEHKQNLLSGSMSTDKLEGKECLVRFSVFEDSLETVKGLTFTMDLNANIFAQERTPLSSIKPLMKQAFIDDMYYQLKNTLIAKSEISKPVRIEFLHDNITWKFYVSKKDKENMLSFIQLLEFRVEYFSSKNEKKREILLNTIRNTKNNIEKEENFAKIIQIVEDLAKKI